jgi:hypothetical protein
VYTIRGQDGKTEILVSVSIEAKETYVQSHSPHLLLFAHRHGERRQPEDSFR